MAKGGKTTLAYLGNKNMDMRDATLEPFEILMFEQMSGSNFTY